MNKQQSSFDAEKYKIAQREQWNKNADAWHHWNPTLDRWIGAATREMLYKAMITTGQRVLDVAAGAGEPALRAEDRIKTGPPPIGYFSDARLEKTLASTQVKALGFQPTPISIART